MDRRVLIVSLLSAGLVAGTAAVAGDSAGGQAPAPPRTGKERLSDKASDEQRVDDCEVPPERRGPRLRPTDCARRADPTRPATGATPVPD